MNKKLHVLIPLLFSFPFMIHADGLLTYRPPQLKNIAGVIGGGTRSLTESKIQVLAPQKHASLTAQTQPILYWYASELHPQKVEFILIEEGASEPLIEEDLAVSKTGLQVIRLADYDVSLEVGKKYRWSLNAEYNSENSHATLIYLPSSPSLVSVEQKAENGYWYDALQQLIEARSPLANALLQQIDLKVVLF